MPKSKAMYQDVEGINISVQGRHVELTEALKDFVVEKVSKLDRFSTQIADINIVLEVQKLEHRADIVMKVGHTMIKSHGIASDMYASIEQAFHRLERRLKCYMQKLKDHHAKPQSVIDMNVQVIERMPLDLDELNDAIEEENLKQLESEFKAPKVVSNETRPLKTLTTDEAIMQLELSGKYFKVFVNEQTNELEIVHRRNDGNYGVIQPKRA